MNRLHNLDYLRGLAAFAIMIYHYFTWTTGLFHADEFIGRIGIYGVSIFYILSGITLHYVYYERMEFNKKDLIDFFKRRFFRIFPLLWLVTILTILVTSNIPSLSKFMLNMTGLFGLVRWSSYIAGGAWSIGNELVFYLFFPFFVFFAKKSRVALVILTTLLFGIYVHFAFNIIDPLKEFHEKSQWNNYLNPLNQVFLFLGGFLIGLVFSKTSVKQIIAVPLLLLGVGLFVFYPAEGDKTNLFFGVNRLAFTAISLIICFAAYKITVELPAFIHKPLAILGETSYSVYLIHPVIYRFFENILKKYSIGIHFYYHVFASMIVSLIVSYFVYQYFEKYFMRMGKPKKVVA